MKCPALHSVSPGNCKVETTWTFLAREHMKTSVPRRGQNPTSLYRHDDWSFKHHTEMLTVLTSLAKSYTNIGTFPPLFFFC